MTAPAHIREATADDISVLVKHRRWMIEAIATSRSKPIDSARLDTMEQSYRGYLQAHLADGTVHAWIAEVDGRAAASGTISPLPWPPADTRESESNALLHSVYTLSAHRRKGIARQIVDTAIAWCEQHRIHSVFLGASEEGRPLYESIGFQPLNHMRLMLPRKTRSR